MPKTVNGHELVVIVDESDKRLTAPLDKPVGGYRMSDVGKLVAFTGDGLAGLGSGQLMGVLESLEPYTSQGHQLGTVRITGRIIVEVSANQVDPINDLDFVDIDLAHGESSPGTPVDGYPKVIKTNTPGPFRWIKVAGEKAAAVAGDKVLIERV